MPKLVVKLALPFDVLGLPTDTPKERAIEVFKNTPGMGPVLTSMAESEEIKVAGVGLSFDIEE